MKIKGYFPLRCSDVFEDSSIYTDLLKELNGFEYEIIHKKNHGKLKFTIAYKKSQIRQISSFTKLRFPLCDSLLIVEGKLLDSSFPIAYLIEKRMRDLFVLTSICKNGVFDSAAEGQIFINGKHQHTTEPFIHSIDMAVPMATKIKWPNLITLQIKDSLKWWSKYQKSIDNISENKIGRALNAFSHFFHSQGGSDDPAILFWAVLALEALYAEGNSSLQDQINKKSQAFLGERQEFKKRFSQLYDYRSKFVHGALNFENKNFIEDATIVEDHLQEFWDNKDFAISILLATLQKLIQEDKHDLDFEYRVKATIA